MMPSPCRPWREVPALLRAGGVAEWTMLGMVLFLLGTWLRRMVPEWSTNPDLSHGFFVPILCGVLIYESRQRGRLRWLPSNPLCAIAVAILLLGGCGALALGSLFAAALDWSHAMVLFLLGMAAVSGLAALLIGAADAKLRLVPLNWISLAALVLVVLSLPLPPGTYNDLTAYLQLQVSHRVLQALHLLGIPAILNGNIIELATTSVGVEDACSGVRSLLSCIFAGFFFSAAFVQKTASRVAIIVLSPLLAIVMNFLRSLLLTLLANRGIDIRGTWHDSTGFAILVVTAALLWLLALLLEKIEDQPAPLASASAHPGGSSPARFLHQATPLYVGGFGLATFCVAFFGIMTRPAAPTDTPVPDVMSFMPATPPGWRVSTSHDLYRFAEILSTDQLGQRIYLKDDANGELLQITVYVAYWSPGQAPVSSVATHTPDACWPGAGWIPQPVEQSTVRLPLGEREISTAEYRLFHNQRMPQHVWFWHSYDRRVIREFNPRRPLELLASVLEYGVRSQGEQMFIRLSSNRPWSAIQHEPLVHEVLDRLAPFGL